MSCTWRFYVLGAVLFLVAISLTTCKTMAAEHEGQFGPDLALIDDDGSLDTALINYLFARQMMRRLQSSMDVTDLQHKRSYWKQCAFNAVSCFGRK